MNILDLIHRLKIIEMKYYDEKFQIKGIAFHSLKVESAFRATAGNCEVTLNWDEVNSAYYKLYYRRF